MWRAQGGRETIAVKRCFRRETFRDILGHYAYIWLEDQLDQSLLSSRRYIYQKKYFFGSKTLRRSRTMAGSAICTCNVYFWNSLSLLFHLLGPEHHSSLTQYFAIDFTLNTWCPDRQESINECSLPCLQNSFYNVSNVVTLNTPFSLPRTKIIISSWMSTKIPQCVCNIVHFKMQVNADVHVWSTICFNVRKLLCTVAS